MDQNEIYRFIGIRGGVVCTQTIFIQDAKLIFSSTTEAEPDRSVNLTDTKLP